MNRANIGWVLAFALLAGGCIAPRDTKLAAARAGHAHTIPGHEITVLARHAWRGCRQRRDDRAGAHVRGHEY